MDRMVVVAELAGAHVLLQCAGLGCGAILVGTADIQGLIALGTAEACEHVRGKYLQQVPKVGNVVHVRQSRGNQSFFHRPKL